VELSRAHERIPVHEARIISSHVGAMFSEERRGTRPNRFHITSLKSSLQAADSKIQALEARQELGTQQLVP
jgi:hypothetical protein